MDHGGGQVDGSSGELSRRHVLRRMVALAALAGCTILPEPVRTPAERTPVPSRAPGDAVVRAYVLAMHLHASTSEGVGSVQSHLQQAAATGFDVAWFTEHDWRRRRLLYRPTYSFLLDEPSAGGTWTVDELPSEGSPDGGSGSWLVFDPTTPNDPAPRKGTLRLRARSTGNGSARVARRVHAEGTSRSNFRSRIAGRAVSVDVLPSASGPDSWGEVVFGLSHHPAAGGRPEGVHAIAYRLRPDVGTAAARTEGTLAIVDLPVELGRWQSVTFDLTGDVGRAWPDL